MEKRVVAVNPLSFGSTGKIMQGIAHEAAQMGWVTDMFVGANGKAIYTEGKIHNISSSFGNRLAINLGKLTGLEGCFAILPTLKMLKTIDAIDPEVIHLHLLHHSYVNIPILFRYLKKKNIPVVWTFHDCWAFTGHCPHFEYEKCEKWKRGCFDCPRYKDYPKSLIDNSRFMWKLKKKWFSGLSDVTIVAPSEWLADLAKESFLGNYTFKVVPNGIDLEVFKPQKGDIRAKYSIGENEKIVLGVASAWSDHKGLDAFIKLSETLPEGYKIILVGTNEEIDKSLPENIISIHRTENQQALAELYTVADVFANPTREDTFPTVNIEALACGTPVVTFRTGGSPESLNEECGVTVDCDDIAAMEREIIRICSHKPFKAEDCRRRAEGFESSKQLRKYADIYEQAIRPDSREAE